MGFFSTIKNTFNKVTHAVGGFFHDAGSTISHDAHAVASTVETAVTTVSKALISSPGKALE